MRRLAARASLVNPGAQAGDRPNSEVGLEQIERKLLAIWREVLDRESIELHDDYFELGGNSLGAVQIATRASAAFELDVPLDAIFEARTVAAFARLVEAEPSRASHRGPPRRRDEPNGLSAWEAEVWSVPFYDSEFGPQGCDAFLLNGPLDVPALEWAVTELVQRHESLRTIYPMVDHRPVARVLAPEPVQIPITSIAKGSRKQREQNLSEHVSALHAEPLDFRIAPPLRIELVRMGPQSHALVLILHEIICDGQGLATLLHELSLLYGARVAGRPSPLEAPALQYRDAIHMQREERAAEGRAYWDRVLAEAPLTVPLPFDDGGRATFSAHATARATVHLPDRLCARLRSIGRDTAATSFMTHLAGLFLLLHRHTGETELIVQSSAANRTRVELEPVVGLFARVLPLTVTLHDNPSFVLLLQRTRDMTLAAFSHANQLPVNERLRCVSGVWGLTAQVPTYRLSDPDSEPALELAGIRAEPILRGRLGGQFLVNVDERAGHPASLTIASSAEGWDQREIKQMVRHYEHLLERAAEDPDRPIGALDTSAHAGRSSVLAGAKPERDDAATCLHDLVAQQARRTPDAVAIEAPDEMLTYAELDARAERLARRLRERGLQPGAYAGLALEPSVRIVVAMLAVLKAQGICIPLAGGGQRELRRLSVLLADETAPVPLPAADAVLELAVEERAAASAGEASESLPAATPDQVAFMVFTAGVTGPARLVSLTHRTLTRNASWLRTACRLAASDRALHAPGPGVLTWALTPWRYLASGARVVVPDRARSTTDAELPYLPDGLTIVSLPPVAAARCLRSDGTRPASLRLVLVQGPGPLALAPDAERRGVAVLRQYAVAEAGGPVLLEAAKRSTWRWDGVVGGSSSSEGAAVQVSDVYGQAVPVGVVGELCLVNDAEPVPTRDLGRRRADGVLEFIGRRRDEARFRGFRLNAGMSELEETLELHPAISTTVASWHAASESLVVSAMSRYDELPPSRDLDDWVGTHMDRWILPARYVLVDAIPLRPDGSFDRSALAESADRSAVAQGEHRRRLRRTEKELMKIWRKVLKRRQIDIHDNFFTIGGNRMLGVEVAERARVAGLELTPRMVVTMPTIAEIATVLDDPIVS